jgi:hypothetical protein
MWSLRLSGYAAGCVASRFVIIQAQFPKVIGETTSAVRQLHGQVVSRHSDPPRTLMNDRPSARGVTLLNPHGQTDLWRGYGPITVHRFDIASEC